MGRKKQKFRWTTVEDGFFVPEDEDTEVRKLLLSCKYYADIYKHLILIIKSILQNCKTFTIYFQLTETQNLSSLNGTDIISNRNPKIASHQNHNKIKQHRKPRFFSSHASHHNKSKESTPELQAGRMTEGQVMTGSATVHNHKVSQLQLE